jgi:alpha-glucosidase
VPLPWSGTRAPYGFGPADSQPWIPQPDDWAGLTAEAQERDPGSTLSFYRRALAARREVAWTAGESVELLDRGADVLAFRRGPLTVVLNCGATPVPLPEGEVVLASGSVEDGKLPADTAVWFR